MHSTAGKPAEGDAAAATYAEAISLLRLRSTSNCERTKPDLRLLANHLLARCTTPTALLALMPISRVMPGGNWCGQHEESARGALHTHTRARKRQRTYHEQAC